MIKLTRVASKISNAPKIFILSGGPGISSLTLRDLDLLKQLVRSVKDIKEGKVIRVK